MANGRSPRLAVLIDADNTSAKVAEGLFLEIAKLGEASVRRIYGDFAEGRMKAWAEVLARHAIVPHQNFAYTQGKNSADIALVIDAMDLLHSGRFDGFVLVSSDSDFTRLASRIREQGLDVYGIGKQTTPEAFRKACKRFIFVENLVSEPAAPGAPAAPQRESPAAAVPLILAAMERLGDEGDWVSLGPLGQTITTLQPDFDSRSYGCAKLSDLIRKAGGFETRKTGNQIEVRRLPVR